MLFLFYYAQGVDTASVAVDSAVTHGGLAWPPPSKKRHRTRRENEVRLGKSLADAVSPAKKRKRRRKAAEPFPELEERPILALPTPEPIVLPTLEQMYAELARSDAIEAARRDEDDIEMLLLSI